MSHATRHVSRFYERHIEQVDYAGAQPQLAGDQHSHAAGGVLHDGHQRRHRLGDRGENHIEFREEVRPQLDAEPGLELTHLSEMGRLGDIRASQTLVMIIEFMDGKAVGYFDPDIPNDDEL